MIKNGVIYRSTNRQSDYDDLAIYSDGSLERYDSSVVNTFTVSPPFI